MKIVIGADVAPCKNSEQLFINGDVNTLFSDVLPIMKNADRLIVNLECALTTYDKGIKKFGPCIKGNPNCVMGLLNAGVTDVALANNHVFDFGKKGLLDTTDTLSKANIPFMGVGKDDTDCRKIYYIQDQGKKIAIVNVCEHEYSYALPNRMGTNPFDPFITMQDIREAKQNSDFVIVLYHGGKEQCKYPSPRLRNACREMVNNGASVVLTQHSHCIGCYEEFNGGHILYGQGNFHFSHPSESDGWYSSLLVELDIDKKVDIKFYPLKLQDATISLMKGEEKEKTLAEFNMRNEELKTGEWKKGWHDFCESKVWYIKAAKRYGQNEDDEEAKQNFAHYLDCEAHLDAWKELFPTWNLTNELDD